MTATVDGTVVGRTSQVAFARLSSGSLVAIHSPRVPAFPFSWTAPRWRDLGLAPGLAVALGDGELTAGSMCVAARRVPAGRILPAADRGCRLGLEIEDAGSPEAQAAVAVLADAIGGRRSLTSTVAGIVGRGPGLTPSADDVLVGILAGLGIAGEGAVAAELSAALQAPTLRLDTRTTPVSAAMLLAAAGGDFAPILADLSLSAGGSPRAIRAAIARLRAVGAQSGGDMLAGIRLATTRRGMN